MTGWPVVVAGYLVAAVVWAALVLVVRRSRGR
jgi:hypothetical protein